MPESSSGRVGPIIFSHEVPRQQLTSEGVVVTYRTSPRTTGETWWRASRTGEKEGDVLVEEVEAGGLLADMLEPYVGESGFSSLHEWLQAIDELNDGQPIAGGWLYRVEVREDA